VQTPQVIQASPLCQQVREIGHHVRHIHEAAPETFESDLASLMEKSDEVVLVGFSPTSTTAITPSGEDLANYSDVTVLRTWKGAHKVGDTLTFGMPMGNFLCSLKPQTSWGESDLSLQTRAGGLDWKDSYGPQILFLRWSKTDETQFIPSFRLTAGDGIQGMFVIRFSPTLGGDSRYCNGVLDGSVEKCNAFLENGQFSVSVPYRLDPLFKKYNGMPLSNFLKEVQATADSLGYAASSAVTK
jgi:hypothetical protein